MTMILLLLLLALVSSLQHWMISAAAAKRTLAGAEVLDFLAPAGHVSVDALLQQQAAPADDDQERINPEAVAAPSSPEFIGRYAQLSACESVPVDWIPCAAGAGAERDPHCESGRLANPCSVPLPRGYMHPPFWPRSMNRVRAENVPNLDTGGAQQWIEQLHGSDIRFKSSRQCVDRLLQWIPGLELGRKIRLVLNLEDGVGNLSVELERYGALTLSLGKLDAAGVTLERGYPALVQALRKTRLPFPSQAFDFIHCGSCDVPWTQDGGLLLREADRLLQRGGLFVWKNTSGNEEAMSTAILGLCWIRSLRKDGLFAWRKPVDDECYSVQQLSFCGSDSWKGPLEPCLSDSDMKHMQVYDWPARLSNATQRLDSPGKVLSSGADLSYWKMLTDFYLSTLSSRINQIRNVLDMNAGYGGFAAALSMRDPVLPWWVLNVSPQGGLDHLANILDKGLLGVYHDWCRALDIPPRSFDLVHASRLFSSGLHNNCSMLAVMLEMDRLLRPGGFAIIRDQEELLLDAQSVARALHWKTTLVDTDSGPHGKDKLLHCQKTSWRPSPAS